MESISIYLQNNFFNVTSSLISIAALILAVLAFRVAKQALLHTRDNDLATRKLQAHEKRALAERSLVTLKMACQSFRRQWKAFHDSHYPKLGSQDVVRNDIRHIDEVEIEASKILKELTLSSSEIDDLDAAGLDKYIEQAEQTISSIEQLSLRLSPPKQLSS